jgi:hypothetical protein
MADVPMRVIGFVDIAMKWKDTAVNRVKCYLQRGEESCEHGSLPKLGPPRASSPHSILPPLQKYNPPLLTRAFTATMINAVLVFNNAGQPRLTKFYTQLVYTPR